MYLLRNGGWNDTRPSRAGDSVDSEDPRAVHVWCRKCFEARAYHPLAAVSATSVGSLANHSLCKCEAVLRQYRGERKRGRLLAQSITMLPVYRTDNQQTQFLLPLKTKQVGITQSASFPMILRPGSIRCPRHPPCHPAVVPFASLCAFVNIPRFWRYMRDIRGVRWRFGNRRVFLAIRD